MWEEHFRQWTDKKPYGPSSVGVDISVLGASHVYGLPEHSTRFDIPLTKGQGIDSDPMRLYNLDVFEYELNTPMSLYGSVPFVMAVSDKGRAAGIFWLNPSETWIDVSSEANPRTEMDTHWFSETGRLDVFLIGGPSPRRVLEQYIALTGPPVLPPLFALGYHQCRWNYRDEHDVAQVDAGFEEHNIPYDVIWLDIEHTDGKRYFTWDKALFPHPEQMQADIARKGRKMVTIVDPHIKRDPGYYIHKDALDRAFYVKSSDGTPFEGHCWPGSSSYPDFSSPDVRDWWATRHGLDVYKGSTPNLWTWCDMSEPSVFSGPEVTMPKDAQHLNGQEHRELHNAYGFYYHLATFQGHTQRLPEERPFILTRSFFAGTQRLGAIWTGDNQAKWEHLAVSTPMLLSMGIAALPFVGADVGGFFGNPGEELLVRWYQAAAWHPFFRGHAHLETKRREPWLFGEENTARIRNAVRQRYAVLPYIYTTFFNATRTGLPVMRPLWIDFPGDVRALSNEEEFMMGSDLLVRPVTTEHARSVSVYLPGEGALWYDYATGAPQQVAELNVAVNLESIPVFQRGGSIVPRWDRPRRSSFAQSTDPMTLVVAPDRSGSALGTVFLDDGHSRAWEHGHYLQRVFSFDGRILSNRPGAFSPARAPVDMESHMVERMVLRGVRRPPSVVRLMISGLEPEPLRFVHDAASQTLVVRIMAPLAIEWDVQLR